MFLMYGLYDNYILSYDIMSLKFSNLAFLYNDYYIVVKNTNITIFKLVIKFSMSTKPLAIS